MIIFRWQAHDSKVECGVSPQQNNNFSHQGEKETFGFPLRGNHALILLNLDVFIRCDLEICLLPQQAQVFAIRNVFQKTKNHVFVESV